MNENNKLWIVMSVILGSAFLMIGGVMAYDRRENLAFVEHFLDFHLDQSHIMEEIREHNERKLLSDKNAREWSSDMQEWGSQGTFGNPDHDK